MGPTPWQEQMTTCASPRHALLPFHKPLERAPLASFNDARTAAILPLVRAAIDGDDALAAKDEFERPCAVDPVRIGQLINLLGRQSCNSLLRGMLTRGTCSWCAAILRRFPRGDGRLPGP